MDDPNEPGPPRPDDAEPGNAAPAPEPSAGPWAPRPDPTQDSFSAWDGGNPTRPVPTNPDAVPPGSRLPHLPPPGTVPPDRVPPQVTYQPAPAYAAGWQAPPNNHLVAAILTTLFCFMPFGIVSIVKATSVNTLWAQGRWDDAHRAARSALSWAIAAVVAVPVVVVGVFLLMAVASVVTR